MMTHGNYDWDAFCNVSILQQSRNREDQERLNRLLFDFGSENGWKICASFLLRDHSFSELYKHASDLSVKDFFCYRGIEEFIKTHYSRADDETAFQLHLFVWKLFESFVSHKTDKKENFLRNKCVQIATRIAIIDYPSRWPSFFEEFVRFVHKNNANLFVDNEKDLSQKQLTTTGIGAFELFLKFLIGWDGEVGSKEMQTDQFIDRNTAIKDWMREHDISAVIESVLFVISAIGMSNVGLLKKALKTVSYYISWIDIRLVVSDEIIEAILKPLLPNIESDDNTRSAALDCLVGIINKGMSTQHKLELIGFIDKKMTERSVWQWMDRVKEITDGFDCDFGYDEDENDDCFFVTLGSLINAMGMNLIDCYKSLKESKNEASLGDCLRNIYEKMKLALMVVKCRNNIISATCLQFVQNFITLLKSIYRVETKKTRRTSNSRSSHQTAQSVPTVPSAQMGEEENTLVKSCLIVLATKLQLPERYNFDKEDEFEGKFQTFRRQLLIVFTNIIQLNDQMSCKFLSELLSNTVKHLDKLSYLEVEAVLTMIFHLGEAVKSIKGDFFCAECEISKNLKEIMEMLCSSEIGRHKNPEVRLVFFEIVFRYEKYFNYNSEFLMGIIFLFLSEFGLKSNELRVVSRCVYILSRLIKSHKSKFGTTSFNVLQEITAILQSSFVNNAILTCDNPSTISAYSYLYETAVMLLMSLEIPGANRIFHDLIQPIIVHIPQLCSEWSASAALAIPSNDRMTHCQNINNIKASRIALSIHSAATYINYTCRVFSGPYSMSALNCLDVFMNALDIFIGHLQIAFNHTTHPLAVGREKINSGLRSLIHILCKAAQSDSAAIAAILLRLPHAIELFLSHLSLDNHGLIPLCTELEEIIPLFMQIINAFKNQSIDFLKSSLWTLFRISDNVINASGSINYHSSDEISELEIMDKIRQLRRLYLSLITSDVQLVFSVLPNDQIVHLLSASIQLIHDIEHLDPILIKLCVHLFHKIITILPTLTCIDQHCKEQILFQLIYKQLLPLTIYLPSCHKFNLSDAQFSLTLVEMANFQRSMFLNGGTQFIQYLQMQCLPELNFNQEIIVQYCQALNHHEKDYQTFLKNFYVHAKSK